MHNVPHVEHPGYQKIIEAIISQYFWILMKKDVVDYISRCIAFQRVKDEHRHPMGLLQPLSFPEWKWKVVRICFITKLPRITRQHDSIMVVVEKLTNVAHFIPIKMTHKEANIVEIYMK